MPYKYSKDIQEIKMKDFRELKVNEACFSEKFMFTEIMIEKAYKGISIPPVVHAEYGYLILASMGTGLDQNTSIITIVKVWGDEEKGRQATRTELVRIPLCSDTSNIHQLTAIIQECLIEYPNATILLNGNGLGLAQNLKSLGISFKPMYWGGQCFSEKNKKLYVNKRAQAYVCLSHAVNQGRLRINTTYKKNEIVEQSTRIPYTFDKQGRIKILSNEEMRRKGITTPNIVETIALMFLEGVSYNLANESTDSEYII